MRKARFCPRGHDTWETGRYTSYRCVVCTKEDARDRELREGRVPQSEASKSEARAREKEWRRTKPGRIRAYNKRYRMSALGQAKAREYRSRPEVKARATIATRQWRQRNRAHVNQLCLARAYKAPPLKKPEIDVLLEYYGPNCVYCGSEATGFDHLNPVSKGGQHSLENLAPACGSCNSRKSNHPIWVMVAKGGDVSSCRT
jgi:5-methylcytosine-specific restriction endonuclease McrA